MKIRYGSGRIVVFVGGFAIKICRLTPLWNMVIDIWQSAWKKRWSYIPSIINRKWYWFRKGVKQNVSEYRCWKSCKAPFLVPTYFTFGLINIQKAEYGEEPNIIEMARLDDAILAATSREFNELDPHCLNPKNFLRNEHGYKIVDYGDGSSRVMLFPLFITKWQKELAKILCK